jgi:hypothetical protein
MIGLYGTIFFHSGTTGLTTFDEMNKTVAARWGDHPVHLAKPLLEYSGPQLIEITFKMELIKPFTADPLGTIIILEEIMDLAIPLPLIIGMKPMGRGLSLFVLASLKHQMKYFYRGGGLLGASVEVELKEYPTTISISSLMRALGGVFGGQGAAGAAGTTAAVTPTGEVQVGALGAAQPLGTDANAAAIPADVAATEKNAYDISVDNTLPQIAQNAGNPVPANLGFSGSISQPPQPPSIPAAEQAASGD